MLLLMSSGVPRDMLHPPARCQPRGCCTPQSGVSARLGSPTHPPAEEEVQERRRRRIRLCTPWYGIYFRMLACKGDLASAFLPDDLTPLLITLASVGSVRTRSQPPVSGRRRRGGCRAGRSRRGRGRGQADDSRAEPVTGRGAGSMAGRGVGEEGRRACTHAYMRCKTHGACFGPCLSIWTWLVCRNMQGD